MEETIRATGHRHVTAAHTSTFEVTSEAHLTPAGDCIVGVGADRTPADFDATFVEACRDAGSTITARLTAAGRTAVITGRGDPDLSFASDVSAVVRTSGYVDDRTVLVGADAAAADLDRSLVEALAGGARLSLTLRVG